MVNDNKVQSQQRQQEIREKIKQNKYKKKRDTFVSIIMVLIVVVAFVAILGPELYYNSQVVYVDGEKAAVISGTQLTEQEFNELLMAKLRERAGNNIQINEKIEFKKAHTPKEQIAINTDVIIAEICNKLTYKGEGAVIKVNGKETIVLASKAEAENVIKMALEKYKPKGSNVKEVSFIDDIKVESKFVDTEEVSTPETALKLLTATNRKQTVYTVQAGDTFGMIAQNNNMTEKELLELNPSVTESTKAMLYIGQTLNVMADVPVYPVKTVIEEEVTTALPMSADIHTDDSRYKTYQLVVDEGKAGECKRYYDVTYINGYEKDSVLKDTVVTEPAVNKRVIKGTQEKPTYYASCSFIYPIKGCYISSGFGPRNYGSGRHYGTDFAASYGTEIYASDSGVVTKASNSGDGYGNCVIIDHNNGFKTLYGHCSSFNVKSGQKVKKGQVIAFVGSTGDSTGNHVHFEIMQNNVKNDPMDYLA